MSEQLYITGFCQIRNNNIFLNGKSVFSDTEQDNPVNEFLKNGYRHFNIQYPKFFKMDALCKLGFLTAELLLQENTHLKTIAPEEIGVVLSNASSSLNTDLAYYDTIKESENYFPSPAIFVYTLPNIIIGEICIRHKFYGENAFFVSEHFDPELLFHQVKNVFAYSNAQCMITGWVELINNTYDSFLCIVERKNIDDADQKNGIFDIQNLTHIFTK
jgi:hypothetical protein